MVDGAANERLRLILFAGLDPDDPASYTYDAARLLQLSAENNFPRGGGGGLTTEQVQDAVAAMLVEGSNVTLTYNDVSGTLTITSTGGSGGGGGTSSSYSHLALDVDNVPYFDSVGSDSDSILKYDIDGVPYFDTVGTNEAHLAADIDGVPYYVNGV